MGTTVLATARPGGIVVTDTTTAAVIGSRCIISLPDDYRKILERAGLKTFSTPGTQRFAVPVRGEYAYDPAGKAAARLHVAQ